VKNARDLLQLLTERYPPPAGRHHALWVAGDGKLHLMLHDGDEHQDVIFEEEDLDKDAIISAKEIEALNPRTVFVPREGSTFTQTSESGEEQAVMRQLEDEAIVSDLDALLFGEETLAGRVYMSAQTYGRVRRVPRKRLDINANAERLRQGEMGDYLDASGGRRRTIFIAWGIANDHVYFQPEGEAPIGTKERHPVIDSTRLRSLQPSDGGFKYFKGFKGFKDVTPTCPPTCPGCPECT
jgi:hypothetical protein